MRASSRKLIGAVILLGFVVVYALVAMLVGAVVLEDRPEWVRFAYFVVAGVAWALPAMVLIRWMQRPDADA